MTAIILALLAAAASNTVPSNFAAIFQPNAEVCVRFDASGHPIAAAIDGRLDRKDLNSRMLKLLQGRHWNRPTEQMVGKWIALSVAPDGSPVPEILPDCSSLPAKA